MAGCGMKNNYMKDLSSKIERSSSTTEIELNQLTSAYFNLEVGEWEPLIEKLAVIVNINDTASILAKSIEF